MLRRAVRSMRLLGCRGPGPARAARRSRGPDGAVLPRAGPRLRADLADRVRRGGGVPARPCAPGTHDPRRWRSRDASRRAARSCPATQAFQLHDTYGFPIDLTLEMAGEQGLAVDEDGFRRLMAEQRDRAKADAQAQEDRARRPQRLPRGRRRPGRRSSFTGYDEIVVARRRCAGCCVGGGRSPARPARATRSSWCSTAPRSTPRAAASSPTPGVIELDGGRARGRRRAVADHRADRAPGAGGAPVRCRRGPGRAGRSSTSSGAGRSAARTPRPTWCTRRCARRSARRPPRPVRRTPRAGSGSTSTPPAAVPPSGAARRRGAGQRRRCSTTSRCTPR